MHSFLKILGAFSFLLTVSGLWVGTVCAQEKGHGALVVTVQQGTDQQSDVTIQISAQGSTESIVTTHLGTPVNLPPGTYRITFDVLGGKVTRDNVLVKAGRTSTVIINNLAGLQINVLDKSGKDLGITVEIYDAVSGQKLGAFLSGETALAHPGVVDVKIAIPPQSHWMRQVELQNNTVAHLNFREQIRGELLVRPVLRGKDVSALTQVIISQEGVNREVARSEPSHEHRFTLSPGAYSILVMNPTGVGKPFVQDRAELKGDEMLEKQVQLDGEGPSGAPLKPESF